MYMYIVNVMLCYTHVHNVCLFCTLLFLTKILKSHSYVCVCVCLFRIEKNYNMLTLNEDTQTLFF